MATKNCHMKFFKEEIFMEKNQMNEKKLEKVAGGQEITAVDHVTGKGQRSLYLDKDVSLTNGKWVHSEFDYRSVDLSEKERQWAIDHGYDPDSKSSEEIKHMCNGLLHAGFRTKINII